MAGQGPTAANQRPASRPGAWTLVWLLLAVCRGLAQEPRTFYFSSPLRITGIREQHLPLESGRVNEWAGAVALPGMSLARFQPRTEASLSYFPEYERFASHTELSSWTHRARFRLSHKITPLVTFSASDAFLQTDDPGRAYPDSVLLLPRSRYRENVVNLGIGYEHSPRTTFSFALDNAINYLRPPSAIQPRASKQLSGAGTAAISRLVAEGQRVTGSYSYLIFRDLSDAGPEPLPTVSALRRAHSLTLDYGFTSEQGASLSFSGGWLRDRGNSYTVSARVGKTWRTAMVSAGYSRYLSISRVVAGLPDRAGRITSGVLPGSVFHSLTANIAGSVGGRLGMELGATAGQSDEPLPDSDIRTLTGRVRLTVRAHDRVYPFAGAEFYGQNFLSLTQSNFSRMRFTAGIGFVLHRLTEREAAQVRQEGAEWPASIPGLVSPYPGSGPPGEDEQEVP